MDLSIERDALINSTTPGPPATPHDDHAVSSFTAAPKMDMGLLQKMLSWWKAELKPGLHVVSKDTSGLRHMFIVTSNSYQDREDETISSAALKAYEDSCYPGEDLFHCDNPLLWWHDDDVVMGEIVAVNYSEPLLIEVARELPTAVSKILFDYAKQNGDSAGASHRFGYLDKDRDPDGTYHRIFKQETSYLPERSLAANSGTYAGVIKHMASSQSDKRLDEIFEKAAGIKGASALIHAKSGELDKQLEAAGIAHKATKPPVPPIEADAVAPETTEEVAEDAKADTPPDMNGFMTLMNQVYTIVMEMVDAQLGLSDTAAAMAKELKELKDERVTEKAAKTTLEQRLGAAEKRLEIAEKRLSLAPQRAADQTPLDPKALASAVEIAEKSRKDGELVDDPIFGKLKPPVNYGA